jgi:hypothetical protein
MKQRPGCNETRNPRNAATAKVCFWYFGDIEIGRSSYDLMTMLRLLSFKDDIFAIAQQDPRIGNPERTRVFGTRINVELKLSI